MKKRIIALAFVCVLVVAFWVYLLITYAGKPITEIPAWAIWFLFYK